MPRNIRLCDVGVKILKFFLVTSTAIVLSLIWFGLITKTWNFGANPFRWIAIGIILFLLELVLFWIGIIMVYVSSLQLGVKTRVLGIVCGWIPFVNLFALMKIIASCTGYQQKRSAAVQNALPDPVGTRCVFPGFRTF